MAEGGLDEYESWKCSKTAERLYCPPEGCPSAYGCAREKGWMSGMPSPPECQGSYPKVNATAGAGPSAEQHTAAMEAARRIINWQCAADGNALDDIYPFALDVARALLARVVALREALTNADGYLEADDAEERLDPSGIRRKLRAQIRAALASPPRDGE